MISSTPSPTRTRYAQLGAACLRNPQLRKAMAVVCCTLALQTFLGLAAPILTSWLVSDLLPNAATHSISLATLTYLSVGIYAAYIKSIRLLCSRYIGAKVQEVTIFSGFEDLLNLPFRDAVYRPLGTLQMGLNARESAGSIFFHNIFIPVAELLSAVPYALFLESQMAGARWLFLSLGGALAFAALSFGSGAYRAESVRRSAQARQRSGLFEFVRAMATLRLFGAEKPGLARWHALWREEVQATFRCRLFSETERQLLEFASSSLSTGILLVSAYRCLHHGMEVGAMLASVQATMSLWAGVAPLVSASRFVWELHKSAQADEVALSPSMPVAPNALSDERKRDVRDGRDGLQVLDSADGNQTHRRDSAVAIAIQGLWFRYTPDSPWVLADYHLTVARGENARISWPSGRGKTTLLRLVAGLLAPERGSVTIFGQAPSRVSHLVAYLPQKAPLFPGTIRDNLHILSRGASLSAILQAAKDTGFDGVLESCALGIATPVFSGGLNLSSGQRQLLCLTGLLASPCSVLLLDEATSHLDKESATRIDEAFRRRECTLLRIVHAQGPSPALDVAVPSPELPSLGRTHGTMKPTAFFS